MTAESPDKTVKLPRTTKGKRPQFLDHSSADQTITFIIELAAELSVVADRLDTMERLLDKNGTLSRSDIESYHPDAAVEDERMERRDAYLKRIFRLHTKNSA